MNADGHFFFCLLDVGLFTAAACIIVAIPAVGLIIWRGRTWNSGTVPTRWMVTLAFTPLLVACAGAAFCVPLIDLTWEEYYSSHLQHTMCQIMTLGQLLIYSAWVSTAASLVAVFLPSRPLPISPPSRHR